MMCLVLSLESAWKVLAVSCGSSVLWKSALRHLMTRPHQYFHTPPSLKFSQLPDDARQYLHLLEGLLIAYRSPHRSTSLSYFLPTRSTSVLTCRLEGLPSSSLILAWRTYNMSFPHRLARSLSRTLVHSLAFSSSSITSWRRGVRCVFQTNSSVGVAFELELAYNPAALTLVSSYIERHNVFIRLKSWLVRYFRAEIFSGQSSEA